MGHPNEKSEWLEWINHLDSLIRSGNKSAAKHELAAIPSTAIPRPLKCAVAQLCRRANIPQVGIRILSSLVRPNKHGPSEPTVEEKAEYAVCLIRVGAVAEGLDLLTPLSAEKCAPVALYKAFAHIAQWDYRASIDDLRQYLASPFPSPYERLVAKANLLAAYIVEREEKIADDLFEELKSETNTAPMRLLNGSILELGARQSLAQRRFDEFDHRIAQVEKHFSGSNDIHLFYAEKLRVLELVTREGAGKKGIKLIEALRNESLRRHHWETLRECDRAEAMAKQDRALFDKVYLGTPHRAYRNSLLNEFGENFHPPESFEWSVADKAQRPLCFDVSQGGWHGKKPVLKPGQLLHRFLIAMSSDFYKPHRLATLHALLFPNEFYNPLTSPGRVHRTLGRWRVVSRKHGLKIQVDEVDGSYRIAGAIRLRVENLDKEKVSQTHFFRMRLQSAFPDRPFSTLEAALVLGLSRSAAQRILAELTAGGHLKISGAARGTRYHFKIQ